MRRGATFTAAFLACCAAAASPAAAATQLGHTDFPVECSDSGYSVLQTAVAYGDGYSVPAGGGVITSWSIRGNDDPDAAVRLRVFRTAETQGEYVLVGEGERAEPLVPNELNTFPARVAVREGDLLGMRVEAGTTPPCVFETDEPLDSWDEIFPDDAGAGDTLPSAFTGTGYRLNLSAVLEPDADGDGYGDESQDGCPTDAAVHDGPCPAAAPQPDASPGQEPAPAQPQAAGPTPLPQPDPRVSTPHAPRLTLGRPRINRRTGRITIRVTCAHPLGRACRTKLTVSLRSGARRLKPLSRTVRVPSGSTTVVHITATHRERAQLRRLRRLELSVVAG